MSDARRTGRKMYRAYLNWLQCRSTKNARRTKYWFKCWRRLGERRAVTFVWADQLNRGL